MPVVVIFRRHYIHYHGENIFSLLGSNWNVPSIHSQSIVLFTSSVDDSLLISSFLMLILMNKFMTMLGLFLRFVSGSSYAGANIKVDFNSQQAGFTKRPLANTCSSHLHLSTSYMILKEFKLSLLMY